MAKSKRRDDRIAAQAASQEAERSRERDEIKLERFGAPASLEIPLKPCPEGAEPQADIEDEYFGGFDRGDADGEDAPSRRCSSRACGGYLGCSCRRLPAKYSAAASPWVRVWGRIDKKSECWRWAAEKPTNGAHPFIIQAWKQAEQKLPTVTAEQDRAEELERIERRLELLDAPTDPNSGPSRSFARGVYREEKTTFLAQHTERAIQKAWCRRYRPSKALEAKRFPKLERVETRLIPKDGPGKVERRKALRALSEELVAVYLAKGSTINECPSEWTMRELNAIIKKYETRTKRGRPPIGDRAMTPAERQRLRYERRKVRENLVRILRERIAVLHDEPLKHLRDKIQIITATAAPLAPSLGEDANARADKRARCDAAALDQGNRNAKPKGHKVL